MPSGVAGTVVYDTHINCKIDTETKEMLREMAKGQGMSSLVREMTRARYSNWKRRQGK